MKTRLESSSFAELSNTHDALQTVHKTLKADYIATQRDLLRAQQELSSVQAQYASASASLAATQEALSRALVDVQEATTERDMLRSQITDEKNRGQMSREGAAKVQEKIEALQRQVDLERSERTVCEGHVAQCIEDAKRLVAACESERESKVVLQDRIDALERKIISLEDARSKLDMDYR